MNHKDCNSNMAPSKNCFSSRVVGKILEKCIEKKMIQGGTKNRKAWFSKLKLSLQKKISLSSKVAFLSEESSNTDLILEILNLKEKILIQTENLKKKAEQIIKESRGYDDMEQIETIDKKCSGRFDTRATSIQESFREVVKKLTNSLADKGCIQSLEMSIKCNADVLLQARHAIVETTVQEITNEVQLSQLAPTKLLFEHLSQGGFEHLSDGEICSTQKHC